ncbi:GatB/YqeY domain-containing protein [Candidatus Dojkabacteria bacterium]|nr:GatB/YqeY domain-containing protein [Candidatus Dojkabacteria bacterium]
MSLVEQIKKDTFVAIKAKDQDKAGILQIVAADLKNAEIEKGELSEEQEIEIIRGQVKKLKDSIEQFKKGDREDLAQRDAAQMKVLEKYLPKLMGEDEVEKVVSEVIDSVGATSMSDMGRVMGAAMGKLKGKADGSLVKAIVERQLKS